MTPDKKSLQVTLPVYDKLIEAQVIFREIHGRYPTKIEMIEQSLSAWLNAATKNQDR